MRILLVANRTIGGQQLKDAVRERLMRAPCQFILVVPAIPPPREFAGNFGSTFAAQGMTGLPTYDSGRTDAQRRLATGLHELRELGATVDGEVSVENAVEAVEEQLRTGRFDEIIVSTLPIGISRWLKQDLPHRLQRKFGIPVTTIVNDDHRTRSPETERDHE